MDERRPQPCRITTTGLVELLDRVIGGGAVVTGNVIVALAGVDLLYIDLKLLLASTDKLVAALSRPGESEESAKPGERRGAP
jgi:hypothetical protein